MKLRLRQSGRTKRVEIDEDATFHDLLRAVAEEFDLQNGSSRDFQLSLNGNDEMHCETATFLSDLSIVHGDLIHILLPQEKKEEEMNTLSKIKKSEQPDDIKTSAQSSTCEAPSSSASTSNNYSAVASHHDGASTSGLGASGITEEYMECSCDDDEAIQDIEANRYLNEPMLVCDSTSNSVPQALQNVYEEAGVETMNEAACVLLHVLMSESGFSSATKRMPANQEHLSFPLMPSGWKAQKTHRLTYSHESCPGVTFILICVPMDTVVVVHGTATGVVLGEKCQFQFKSADYVVAIDRDASKAFKNLSKFSRLFKDKVAYPVIQLCRQALGQPNTFGLLGLMEEIKLQIFANLDAQSLCRVAQVTHEFQRLSRQPKLWRRLYLRNFGRRTNNDISQDWFKLYKEKYILRREMRERMHQARCVMPPRFIPPPFVGPTDPFPFNQPGFIGGDYDRYPAIPGGPGGVGPALPRPRFDPFDPLPLRPFPPGQGGGLWDRGRRGGGGGGFGRFFNM